jgi:hypothetical protein
MNIVVEIDMETSKNLGNAQNGIRVFPRAQGDR